MPESVKNIQLVLVSAVAEDMLPRAKTMSQAIINITTVRIAVAKSELTSFTPTLAKMAVSAANRADNNA